MIKLNKQQWVLRDQEWKTWTETVNNIVNSAGIHHFYCEEFKLNKKIMDKWENDVQPKKLKKVKR